MYVYIYIIIYVFNKHLTISYNWLFWGLYRFGSSMWVASTPSDLDRCHPPRRTALWPLASRPATAKTWRQGVQRRLGNASTEPPHKRDVVWKMHFVAFPWKGEVVRSSMLFTWVQPHGKRPKQNSLDARYQNGDASHLHEGRKASHIEFRRGLHNCCGGLAPVGFG